MWRNQVEKGRREVQSAGKIVLKECRTKLMDLQTRTEELIKTNTVGLQLNLHQMLIRSLKYLQKKSNANNRKLRLQIKQETQPLHQFLKAEQEARILQHP